jgi:molybdate transport system ATP-binding protein
VNEPHQAEPKEPQSEANAPEKADGPLEAALQAAATPQPPQPTPAPIPLVPKSNASQSTPAPIPLVPKSKPASEPPATVSALDAAVLSVAQAEPAPEVEVDVDVHVEATPKAEAAPKADVAPKAEGARKAAATPRPEAAPKVEAALKVEAVPTAEDSPKAEATPKLALVPTLEIDLALPLEGPPLVVRANLKGPAVAVLGTARSGKTSFLEALAGLRPRAKGRIVVRGQVWLDTTRGIRLSPQRRRVGYVPHDGLLFPHLSVKENIRYGLKRGAANRLDEAVALLELKGLGERPVRTLSAGERQRVAMARALAPAPTLLLLDQPAAALEEGQRERMLPFLLRIRDEMDIPLLYVTHQPEEARALAQESLVLDKGTLKAAGPTPEVLAATPLKTRAPENVLVGTLEAQEDGTVSRLRVSAELTLSVPPSALGAGVRTAYLLSPDDILIATASPAEISARNILRARLVEIEPSEGGVLLHLEGAGLPWMARLETLAVRELRLAPGHHVSMAIAAHALRPMRN